MRKGKQWYWGMKLHIGVDSQSGLAHSAVVTPANLCCRNCCTGKSKVSMEIAPMRARKR